MKLLANLISMACAMVCTAVLAQSYPSKPIRMVVPDGGGGPDVTARIISPQIQANIGQPVIVENRPGANSIIGSEIVAKSAPDGYTWLITTTAFAANPSIYKKLPYDSINDFTPITQVTEVEALIVTVPAASPARTLRDLVAEAKKPGAKLSYGSPGIGNIMHLAGALFQTRAGIEMLHVPYKGTAPAVQALMSNEIQMMIAPAIVVQGSLQVGKMRALAYTHRSRAAAFPDMPTTAEAGVAGVEIDGGWLGMFAAAKTPPEIVNRIQTEIRKSFDDAKTRERILALSIMPIGSRPEEFRKLVISQIARYAELAKLANIEPE
ncbi:MAG: Bug family tripartite tricarboxylate transporter substrate binding protein [Burkholderiales bacterium]